MQVVRIFTINFCLFKKTRKYWSISQGGKKLQTRTHTVLIMFPINFHERNIFQMSNTQKIAITKQMIIKCAASDKCF